MKAAYLLPLPLLFIPFTHAAGYLIRFKEGSATNTFYHHEGISRIETLHSIKTQSTHSTFNYSSNELSLTVLPLTHIKALSHGKNPHHRGKSKAQIDDSKAFEYGTTAHQAPVKINSKGRWFTFNDDEFHVWHGDFTDEEAELLANDAGVELMEKDIVIQFPELEEYMNNKSTMDDKVMRLEQSLDEMEDQMATKMSNGTKSKEEEEKPTLPNTREGSSLHKDKETKKTHRTKDYVTDSDMKESPEEEDGFMVQKDAPSWSLPRISQRNLPLTTNYEYPSAAGQGVDVYIIDTGINIDHVDFEGRAHWGTNTVPGAPNADDNGHGTFVAGIIGSRTFGVAKKANLIAVKGLNSDGTSTLSQILAALDWVIKQNAQSSNHLNVVNLSLGAGFSKVLNLAVDNLVQSGMFIVAAAGNGNERNIGQNACNYSPASCATAFTVGSTNINDQISSFSNYGQCVNIYAPGERVRSTWIGPTNREIYTDSGTSFSAPSVSGIAALIMSTERGDRADGSWSPKNIGNRILQLGTRNVVRNFKGPASTNVLAFNGAGILGIKNTKNESNRSESGNDNSDNNNNNSIEENEYWSPSFTSNTSTPRQVDGPPSVSSTTNHGPTLSVIQTFTILSTIGSTLTFFITSL